MKMFTKDKAIASKNPAKESNTIIRIPFPFGDRDLLVRKQDVTSTAELHTLLGGLLQEFEKTAGTDWTIDALEAHLKEEGYQVFDMVTLSYGGGFH